MAVDPKYATTATTTTTTTTTITATASRPISPLPQHHYSPQPQPHVPIYGPNHHDPSSHSHSHPLLYPVSSSGRGFIPKPLGPIDSSPLLAYSRGFRAQLDYVNHINTNRNHYPHLPATSPPIKALPVSPLPHRKAAPGSAVSDSNGYKDASTRDRSRDDSYCVIRDRKVRITEDASLYALCRSWLRNGEDEENQPQQKDVMKALPKPLPASMVTSYMSNNKEAEKHDEEHEENEEPVEHLSPQDLLKKHIKRARKVRVRLREERLQRIARYRSRLRLLLPPPVEQFRNDTAAGN